MRNVIVRMYDCRDGLGIGAHPEMWHEKRGEGLVARMYCYIDGEEDMYFMLYQNLSISF